MKRASAAVLGSGSWGTMLAQLMTHRGEPVPLWVRNPSLLEEINTQHTHDRALPGLSLSTLIQPMASLQDVARSADLLIVAVPSRAMRDVARGLGELVQGDQMLISGARGLEMATGARMSQILLEETCVKQVGALGGPAYAGELMLGRPGALVIGSGFHAVVSAVQEVLSSEKMRVYGNADLLGVELGGALSTIISLVCGLAHGLELGAGIQAVALDRGMAEIARVGGAVGARAETFYGLSSLGDVTATVLSGASRSFRLGGCLARGMSLSEATALLGPAECVPTTRVAYHVAQRDGLDAPLIHAMHQLLFGGIEPRFLIRALMTRRSVYE